MPSSDDRFARQNRYGPPPEFPLASSWPGIVHHLSGPNMSAQGTCRLEYQTPPRGNCCSLHRSPLTPATASSTEHPRATPAVLASPGPAPASVEDGSQPVATGPRPTVPRHVPNPRTPGKMTHLAQQARRQGPGPRARDRPRRLGDKHRLLHFHFACGFSVPIDSHTC